MYKERMNSYYPEVIRSIKEFEAIVTAEYPEFDALAEGRDRIINDAYLVTMSEERVKQWEAVFGITPVPNATISDRRDTIVARIRGQGKLNTALVNSIVNAFTGGTAESRMEDSVLYVDIQLPPENKQFKLANVERELWNKIPAHLSLQIALAYQLWEEVLETDKTWRFVNAVYDTWNDVVYGWRGNPNELDKDKFDNIILA